MKTGQIVRIKPASPIAIAWGIHTDAAGEVLCTYQSGAGKRTCGDMVDVRFASNVTIWGAPAGEFETLTEATEHLPGGGEV
jgi:hypothetical protein